MSPSNTSTPFNAQMQQFLNMLVQQHIATMTSSLEQQFQAHFSSLQVPTGGEAPVDRRASPNALATAQASPPAPTSSRDQQPAVTAMRSEGTTPKSKKREEYQLNADDIQPDVVGIKDSLTFHIRMLWNTLDTGFIPSDPDPQLLNRFNAIFQTPEQLAAQSTGQPLIEPTTVSIRAWDDPTSRRSVFRHLRRIDDCQMLFVKQTLSRYNLDNFCPDLRQAPYSLYNSACRNAAIDSWRQLALSHAYAPFGINHQRLNDIDLLTKIYNYVVFYLGYKKYVAEARNPGSVQAMEENSNAMRNRSRLSYLRCKFIDENGFPSRYKRLCTPKATSDDERDPNKSFINNRPVFHIKKRPERSAAAEQFIRMLDRQRELIARYAPGGRTKERVRIVPEVQQETSFPRLPEAMPLDYYDPSFYNQLPPQLRAKVADPDMVLLPGELLAKTFTNCEDEQLDDYAFVEKFGEQVLGWYNWVNPEDLVLYAEDDEEYEGDEEDEEGNGGGDDTMETE